MQCPHLSSGTIKLKSTLFNKRQTLPNEWECHVCKTRKSPWLCLHCGHTSCGRYINGHAKSHYNDTGHFLCVDCNTFEPFCYVCDDYVINDTRSRHIEQLRSKLQAVNEHENCNGPPPLPTPSTTTVSNCPTSRKAAGTRSNRTSSSVVIGTTRRSRSGNGIVKKEKRKRITSSKNSSISNVSKSGSSSMCEVNINGLRNLGNTCFMNAVLQSLSNIQQFSGYFKELPSLENVKVKEGMSTSIKSYPSFYGTLGSTYSSRSTTSLTNTFLSSTNNNNSNSNNSNPIFSSSNSSSSSSIVSSTGGKEKKDTSSIGCDDTTNTLLAEELRKTLVMLWGTGNKGAISPESLFAVIWKVVPRYRGYQQQDAHEFLRYILDRLHSELLGILPYHPTTTASSTALSTTRRFFPFEKSTVVTKIFGGLLQNEVTCLVCGNESKKHDPFLDLSLDLPEDCSNRSTDSSGNSNDSNSNSNDRCHLFDCLSSFIRLEELEDTELYHCSFCKKKQKSTKRFWLRRLPNVLCLHLKRFRWNNYFRTKLDTFVEYPIRGLDMSKFVLSNQHETRRSATGGTLYDLAAVIVHHGTGAGSGHYTAYATHGGCWHHFNDSNVTVCEESTVAKASAYILFYIRRQLNLTSFTF